MLFAIVGHLGSGKSTLARALASLTGATVVGFGDYVRVLASRAGRDPNDRAVLQEIGQSEAASDPARFVRDLLLHHSLCAHGSLVFDGVRHRSVWEAIQAHAQALNTPSMLIFVETPHALRRSRLAARGYSEDQIDAWNAHAMENLDHLRLAADMVVDGSLAAGDVVAHIQAASSKSS